MPPLRVAIIGQSAFGAEVYKKIASAGHEIVGVFTIPDDKKGKPDPLAQAAEADGIVPRKIKRWMALKKNGGHTLQDVLDDYKSVNADVNVLAYVSQFIPMEVNNTPKHGSIVFHPSLLPVHRGASAINWTLMNGDKKGGFTIFFADDGLDTGPVLLMRETDILIDDTVSTFYERFVFPEGVKAMGEAVEMIASGDYPRTVQTEEGATYDPMWKKKECGKIVWDNMTTALTLHNFIRGNDRIPGAWCTIEGDEISLYDSTLLDVEPEEEVGKIKIEGCSFDVVVAEEGIVITCTDGNRVCVKKFQHGKRVMDGGIFFERNEAAPEVAALELTADEVEFKGVIQDIWASILSVPANTIEDDFDFFDAGAGSMDVVRLIEETKQKARRPCFKHALKITPDDIQNASNFGSFVNLSVGSLRGGVKTVINVSTVDIVARNGVEVKIPHQLFINGNFVDAKSGKTYETIDPATEKPICSVAFGDVEDVDIAVKAANSAFKKKWQPMNARDRGMLLYKLADLMEEHQDELATIESMDSGAVFTLALKTHIGMSIQTFRYFAGWCDKIQGDTIPINHARPNSNLCFTRKEPFGVVGLVVPWNYPLMMLAWKTAAALAAGNCVVLKPAQVTPLTALKWAQLTQLAGFPPGVVNIIPGSGRSVGQRIADHPTIRKVGFTGSTPVGHTIMESAAKSNLKKVSLELGGKSPLIVFDDADLEKAIGVISGAAFFNKGENCIAAGRIFIQDNIYDDVLKKLIENAKAIKVGDPLDVSVAHGPQNHKKHLDSLVEFVRRGVEEGAKLELGGSRLDCEGLYFPPTILSEVTDKMWIAKEESFGPVMILMRFKTEAEVIRRANNSEFGLASGVLTQNISRALRVAEKLEAGTVFVNTYNKTDVAAPFGGVKESGFGKDLGQEALSEYLHTKTVTIEY
eukprot:m.16504 g.16504  ORF g.16504 m.16504 type:complete len:921 (-) comp11077_c0_seq1:330-3092(-)